MVAVGIAVGGAGGDGNAGNGMGKKMGEKDETRKGKLFWGGGNDDGFRTDGGFGGLPAGENGLAKVGWDEQLDNSGGNFKKESVVGSGGRKYDRSVLCLSTGGDKHDKKLGNSI